MERLKRKISNPLLNHFAMLYLETLYGIFESLFLLSSIFLPFFIITELVVMRNNYKSGVKGVKLYIRLTLYIIGLAIVSFFLSERQRLFIFIFDGLLMCFWLIYYMLKKIFKGW